jgi:alpha-mannosidase
MLGRFKLLDKAAGTKFSGIEKGKLNSVRVIEEGDVRTVIETVLGFEESYICQRYFLPKAGTELCVEIRVFWNHKSKLLKLLIPMTNSKYSYWGQTAFGTQQLPSNGNEAVAQKWVAVMDEDADKCFTCINEGVYGSDFSGQNLRLTLLRSPAYSGHPIENKEIVPSNRFTTRIDQGECLFKFWFNGGTINSRLENIGNESLAKNEKPFALSFFPDGQGEIPKPFAVLNKAVIEVSAIKKAKDNNGWILRLFNSSNKKQSTQLKMPIFGLKKNLSLGPFEIKTLKLNSRKQISEVNLIEEK